LWSLVVKDLLMVDCSSSFGLLRQNSGEPLKSAKEGEVQEQKKTFKMISSQMLDLIYSKIRELVKWPQPVVMRFMVPRAKKHK
jgi:hypothetical protein